ncbi:hypothetical protein J6590_035994 [Homalodisca vitripennis]|nr:hypothetical protein J6590_035994 [Homalodisca vitripennis]
MMVSLEIETKNFINGGGGGFGGGRGGDDFIVQEDTVFVSGMSQNTSEDMIQQHFGSIGIIKPSQATAQLTLRQYESSCRMPSSLVHHPARHFRMTSMLVTRSECVI